MKLDPVYLATLSSIAKGLNQMSYEGRLRREQLLTNPDAYVRENQGVPDIEEIAKDLRGVMIATTPTNGSHAALEQLAETTSKMAAQTANTAMISQGIGKFIEDLLGQIGGGDLGKLLEAAGKTDAKGPGEEAKAA